MKPAITIIDINNCTGCYGCLNACIQNAIEMNLSNEGFLIPSVNNEKCINCGICQKHCPIIDNQLTEIFDNPISIAVWSVNDHTRNQSSSGGVFTEIAEIVLKEGGVVFGVTLDNSITARHISIESEEDIRLIRGSKYVQSHVDDAYKKAVSIALQGRMVLFSGTPCQIAAMNFFIRSNSELEIYTCEVICHGVPSESVFRSYLDYLSQLKNSETKDFSFRDKTLGWKKYGTKIIFNNNEEYFRIHQRDPFMIGFLRNIYLRPICYDCPFAKIPRVADITLGDFWGVPKELDDPRGVSAVIINTQKGEKLFEKVANIEKVKVSLDKIASHNIRLVNGHLEKSLYRKDFYKLLETKGFQAVMEKYLKPYSLFQKCLLVPKYWFRILLGYVRRRARARKLSKIISSYLDLIASSHPRFGCLVRELRFRIWLFRLRDRDTLKVNKIIWINPKNIEYFSLGLSPMSNMGRVIGGDWDKSVARFEDLDVYEAFKRRFICNEDWNTTNFYKRVLSEIQKGRILWKCRNKKEFDERLRKIDGLYNIIKTNGYKSGKEVPKGYHPVYDPLLTEDEVTVNIGREGVLFFNDGRHRLSIAKLLNLPKIPVKVVVRHPDWLKLRKELLIFAKMMSQGKLYQPLTHPDLQDIPSHYGSFRFDLIKSNLSIKKGTVLDIGAQLGYFCHRFEEEGFDCYAVEYNPTTIYFLNKLKKIEKRNFNIISKSIFDYNRDGELLFDVVLCLNIFHHFLKTKKSYEELIILLKRIRTKELFFQSHKYDEPQMNGAYKNFHPEEFAQFISKYTNLKYKLIGKTNDNRKIFKFS